MAMVSIDVKVNIPAMDEQSRMVAEAGIKEVTEFGLQTLASLTPVRTGRLRSSYQKFVSGLSGRITSSASYIWAVEKGTRPHVIVPRTAKALHFMIGGREVFVRSVRHPGSAGRFFIARAAEIIRSEGERIMQKHLANVGKEGAA